jgi:hypothetical protein
MSTDCPQCGHAKMEAERRANSERIREEVRAILDRVREINEQHGNDLMVRAEALCVSLNDSVSDDIVGQVNKGLTLDRGRR